MKAFSCFLVVTLFHHNFIKCTQEGYHARVTTKGKRVLGQTIRRTCLLSLILRGKGVQKVTLRERRDDVLV